MGTENESQTPESPTSVVLTKTHFATAITEETGKFVEVFLVQSCDARRTKDGKRQYLSMRLRDRTGDIEARVWDWDGVFLPAVDMFVKVEAVASAYKEELQLKVSRIREAPEHEIQLEDFLPASKRNRDELLEEVRANVLGCIVNRHINRVVEHVMEQATGLRDAPAAKNNHQPYLGGLLEHIAKLGRLAFSVHVIYPELDLDLLLAAAILHDIGKVRELSYSRSIDYSRRGRLTGHVGIGLQMFHAALPGWYSDDPCTWTDEKVQAREKLDHLEHLISSHHGQKEWGALQVPLSREAQVFHQLDMIEARMGLFDTLSNEATDKNGFTSRYQQAVGGYAYLGNGRDHNSSDLDNNVG